MPAFTAPHPPGALRRAAHALLHWWPTGPAPPRPPRQAQLRALLPVLDEAVAAQRLADLVVAACGESGRVPGSVARAGGEQLTAFERLAVRLRALALDAELAEVRDRASRLLAYHLWMINESLKMAFTSQLDNARIEAARLRINGLGAPADALRELRDDVRQMALGDRSEEPAW